ncbi:MAG: Smr/MutS family protein [Prolixibacteraceae bacterium]|nr:Smr/MutS family protein [Prolixibacteraceae bacterium]
MEATYPDNFELKTGFDRIRELIDNKCISELGKEYVQNMRFSSDFDTVNRQISETDEFMRILRDFPNFPAQYYFDVREALQRIRTEGRFIETNELFDLKRAMDTMRAIVHFFDQEKAKFFPLLNAKTSQIRIYPFIAERIEAILDKTGNICDNASPELARIRREISSIENSISKRLQSILKQAQHEGWADGDASIAIRDGRAVIPVLSGNKRKLKGIVYDESATGKTAYVEPTEIVEMNNEIRELEYAERREIVAILVAVSNDIRPYIDDLIYGNEFIGEMDFIRAKAAWSVEFEAIKPELYNKSIIDWDWAQHPLLRLSLQREKRAIVPLNIRLTEENHILLISGPNAGGKSVCLKTVGLLQFMLQNGLPLPLKEGSKAGIFNQLFIDIGDEQSIENDLSTYSSHLMNMKHFVRWGDERTLVLIDEFGTGTEPALGGAIAEAILHKLTELKTFGVITSHYSNLKHFATSTPGIINGAMLYDSQHMNPLFILEIGKPGSSFAFEIARKIGLPEDILNEATEKVGKKHIDLDRNLRAITRDKYYWETKRQKIRKVEKEVDEMAQIYEKELREASQLRKEILKNAKEEARQILASANKQIENVIREIKESQAEKEKVRLLRQELETLKDESNSDVINDDRLLAAKMEKRRRNEEKRRMNMQAPELQEKKTNDKNVPAFEKGDNVRAISQDAVGELVDFSEKTAVVAIGNLLITTSIENIEKVSGKEARKAIRPKGRSSLAMTLDYSERRLNFKPEIDLRGMRADEALPKVQALIDEAYMFEVPQLRILHGKGNGILKEMIRNYLRTESIVESFRDEHVQFGGAGITVVQLRI